MAGSALGGLIAKLRAGERLSDDAIAELEAACDALRDEGWAGGLTMEEAIRSLLPGGVGRRVAGAQGMLDMICDALVAAMEAGEKRIHVAIDRDLESDDGVSMEFIVVEAFKCSHAETCGEPFHVRVHATAPRYAWPHHEEHRHDG